MSFSIKNKLSSFVTYASFRGYFILGTIWYLSTEQTLRKRINFTSVVNISKKYKYCRAEAKRLVASYLSDTSLSTEEIKRYTRYASKCMLMLQILPWGESRPYSISLNKFAARFGICIPIFDGFFDDDNKAEALAYSKNILCGLEQGSFTSHLLDDELLSEYFDLLESEIPNTNYKLFQKTFRDLVFWQMRSLEQQENISSDTTKYISEKKGAKSYLLLTLALELPEGAVEIVEKCGSWAQHVDDYVDTCEDKRAGIVTYMNLFSDNAEARSFLLRGLDSLSTDISHAFGDKSSLYICMLALSFLEKTLFLGYQNSVFASFEFFNHKEAFPHYYSNLGK